MPPSCVNHDLLTSQVQLTLSYNCTKYGVYVAMVTFKMTLLMNKWANIVMYDGCVHPLAKALPPLVSNLWWNIVMHDWNLDEKSNGKW
jgi:hypothetical protein